MKKTVVIIVLVAMLVGLYGTVALARYIYIDQVSASLAIVGGNATARGTIYAFDPNTITMKIELERKLTSGGSWSVYDNWNFSAPNTTYYTDSGGCSVTSGYTYRTKVTGTVRGENAVAYSSEKIY